MQKPTPQLKVLNISKSFIFLDLIHEKIFWGFIFAKSISADKLEGIDLARFSDIPPPVI